MQPPKCSKCGRPLTNPESIARGMGPECAGTSGKGRRIKVHIHASRGHGHAYAASVSPGQILLPVFSPDPDPLLERDIHP